MDPGGSVPVWHSPTPSANPLVGSGCAAVVRHGRTDPDVCAEAARVGLTAPADAQEATVTGSSPPGGSPPPTGDPRSDTRPTGEVLQSVSTGTQALIKKEIELAKLELTSMLTARAVGAALVAVAGLLGLYVLGFAGVTGAKALELVVSPWLAWLIVTGVYTLVAVVLVLVALGRFKRPPSSPERAKQAFEDTKQWAQGRVERVRR